MTSRFTFSLDDETASKIERMRKQARNLRERVPQAVEQIGPEGRPELVYALARSVHRLDEEPSAASIVREAVAYYLGALEDIERSKALDEAYAAIAAEEGRDRAIRTVTRRAAERWAEER